MVSETLNEDGKGSVSDLTFVGGVLFVLTSITVSAVVFTEILRNMSILDTVYIMGAFTLALINLVMTIIFAISVMRGRNRLMVIIAPIIPFILVLWPFHGLNPLWRTFLIAGLGLLGIALVLMAWHRSRGK
jgi:hypothetical protein